MKTITLLLSFFICFSVLAQYPGDLTITEIMIDPISVSDSDGEYFEVYNNSATAIDLQGFVVADEGSNFHVISSANGQTIIQPNSYFVFARNADATTNGGVQAQYDLDSFVLSNSSDEIIITSPGGQVICQVVYTSSLFPITAGYSIEFTGSLTLDNNSDASLWKQAEYAYNEVDFGSPGTAFDDQTLFFNTQEYFVNTNTDALLVPNPVQQGQVLSFNSLINFSAFVSIYSTSGVLLQRSQLDNAHFVVSNLSSGLYILQIEDGLTLKTLKLVVE